MGIMKERILTRFFRRSSTMRDRPGWRCPDDSELAAYADHRLAENEKARLEAHLADCGFCLGQVAFLVRAQGAELPQDVPGPMLARARELASSGTTARSSRAWRWQALVATAACLVIVGLVTLRQPQRPPAPPTRPKALAPASLPPSAGAPPAEIQTVPPRAARNAPTGLLPPVVISPRDGAVVSSTKLEFRWKPVQGCIYYEVRLLDAEGSVVWEQRTESTSMNLPAEVSLKAGQKYFVWIKAVLAGGAALQSKAVGFILAAGS